MAVRTQIDGNRRAIIGEFEFDAPPQEIWKALSDPAEIAKWFSLRARVEGKIGGEIQFDWKPLFDFEWIDRITVWEEGKRIAFAPRAETVAKEGLDYICEFVITTERGKTKLTMVHSGFTTEAKWDEEFDSYFGGWSYELHSLWHYLTYHRGEERKVLWTRVNFAERGIENPFIEIAENPDIFEGTKMLDLKVGDRYRVRLSNSDVIEGTVRMIDIKAMDFAGDIENFNNGMFRIGAGQRFCFSWLALYSVDEATASRLESALHTRFDKMLG